MDAGHRTHGTGTWARRERTVNNQMKGVCTVITNMSLYSPDKDQDLWTYGSVLSRESHTDLDTGKHEHNLCNIGGATLSLICDCALHKQVMLINRRVLVAHLCCPSRDPCREVPPPRDRAKVAPDPLIMALKSGPQHGRIPWVILRSRVGLV